MIQYTARLTDFTPTECMKKLGVQSGGYVQTVVDAAVIRYCSSYVPFTEGILAGSVTTATVIGSGEVSYDTPYARYLYYGEVYGPSFPIVENGNIVGWWSPPEKHPMGRKLQYSTAINPLAGSYWFERAMADHKNDVLQEARDAAKRRGNP